MSNDDGKASVEPNEFDSKREDQLYQLYLDHRAQLVSHEHELDKAIATANIILAGGAILVSITLVGELEIARTAFISLALVSSWVLLVLSLVCTLLALKYNKDGHQLFYSILDEHAHDDLDNGLGIAQAKQNASPINHKIKFFQTLQVYLTIFGIIALLIATYTGLTTPVPPDGDNIEQRTEETTTEPQSGQE